MGGKVSASNANSSRASSSDASSSRPQSGASDSRPESKGLQRTAVFTASAVALATASEKEVSLEAIDSGRDSPLGLHTLRRQKLRMKKMKTRIRMKWTRRTATINKRSHLKHR